VRKQVLSRLMQSFRYCRCGENVPLLWAFQTEYLILFSRVQCFRLACHWSLCLLVLKKIRFPQTSPPQNFRHSDQELNRHQLCLIDQQYQSTPNTTLSPPHVQFLFHPATFFGQSLWPSADIHIIQARNKKCYTEGLLFTSGLLRCINRSAVKGGLLCSIFHFVLVFCLYLVMVKVTDRKM
jgi:hypothetical protein